MIELLSAIAIIAVLVVIATVFVGNYIETSRLTAARRTVLILNEALNEYRTLGGLSSSHTLQGDNSMTMNQAVLDAMKAGFTNFGQRMTFLKDQPKLSMAALGSTGQGQYFHFTLDEEAAASGKATQSSAISLSPATYSLETGGSLTFTVSGGDGTGEYVWGGDASGSGTSKSVTFSTSGSRTVTVYRAGDSNYGDSSTATATINVGTYAVTTFLSGVSLYGASGMDIDSAGNIFLADANNHVIRKITPAGAISTFAGSWGSGGSDDGTGTAAKFNSPSDIAIDASDNLFVTDRLNSTIRKITPARVVTTFAGSAGQLGSTNATGTSARFMYVSSIVMDGNGDFYVVDAGTNNSVRKVTAAGAVTTFATGMNNPQGITMDSSGNIFVADYGSRTVKKVTSGGSVSTIASGFGRPIKLDCDPSGAVYVTDFDNWCIYKIVGTTKTVFAGSPGEGGTTDGALTDARFKQPCGIVISSGGVMYISEQSDSNRIREITIP